MIQEDCGTSVPVLGQSSFELGNKAWSCALQLVNRDIFAWFSGWVNSVSIHSSFGLPVLLCRGSKHAWCALGRVYTSKMI